jgi:hypothetical protein
MEGAEAFAAWRPKETIKTRSKEEILARMQIALASRAAEELFLDTNLNGVAGDFAGATATALAYVGVYGMDGTISSVLGYANFTGSASPGGVKEMSERVEAVLQSQLKAVKRLLQDHREALIAVAETLIERDELVADEIKRVIDEADARRVTRLVMSEFEEVLGNGHKNGTNGKNGHTLIGAGSSANGDGYASDMPKALDSSLLPPETLGGKGNTLGSTELPTDDNGPMFFMGG